MLGKLAIVATSCRVDGSVPNAPAAANRPSVLYTSPSCSTIFRQMSSTNPRMAQPDETPIVYVVDHDPSVRAALIRLLRSAGLETLGFGSVDELMHAGVDSRWACVVAESSSPGSAGIALPRRLAEAGRSIPVIVLAVAANGKSRAAARSAGAFSFFRKPVDGSALIDAVEWALGDALVRGQDPV